MLRLLVWKKYPDPYAVVSNCMTYTIAARHQTVALMVSYNLILCDFCGDDVYKKFFGEPNSSPNEVRCAEQLSVSAAT